MNDISDMLVIILAGVVGSILGFCSMSLVIVNFGLEGGFFYMLFLTLIGLIVAAFVTFGD